MDGGPAPPVDVTRTLASCAAQVFAQPLAERLKLLCAVLAAFQCDDYLFDLNECLELSPDLIVLTQSLQFALLLPCEKAALPAGPNVVVTMRHRFTPPEVLRGSEDFGASHRGALLLWYLLSSGGGVPFADCNSMEDLLAAPNLQVPALPQWADVVGACAVVELCVQRSEIMRPPLKQLRQAVRGLLWAAKGREKDSSLPDNFFLPFGATWLERQRRIEALVLESLVPRNVLRVGGLRRMNSVFKDCAVTTMLCLKQLGLNRDVAFLVVQWTIRMEENLLRCVEVSSDMNLSDEKSLDVVLVSARRGLWDDPSKVSAARFASFAEMLRLKRCEGPEWVFDLVRTLGIPGGGAMPILRTSVEAEKFDLLIWFADTESWNDVALEQYKVIALPGGKYATCVPGSELISRPYSSLFRLAMHRWHRFHFVRGASFQIPADEEVLVGGITVGKVALPCLPRIEWVVRCKNGRLCLVVQEDSHLFLLPSIETDDRPFVFKTLQELVNCYECELSWMQSGSEDVPAECAWLNSMFDASPEIVLGSV